ncbi:universal stress protein [Parasporobacterium paucivorans]|uniref:Nucleotide-binding universal stress protein, UspA family n=1 Tax=Parasporobacterium paucivorans DSM 15970 TaxID=1122934 RepID=A0A1M6GZ07_9FIRM|nr:universal stress protein [Parasporobacterium paucivorans]SHJ15146.1 Nucleotide-binding universal stress protein, UspA family [Parasporobacterium paucivorans DSM 15970]
MNRKILVALDNSDYAPKVMYKALELAGLYDAQLIGVSVIDNSYLAFCDVCSPYAADTEGFWDSSFQGVLEKCSKLAEESHVDYSHEMLHGNPAWEIIKYAEEKGVDFIVIGNLGKTAQDYYLIGSVAQRVISHCKCPVFIVK